MPLVLHVLPMDLPRGAQRYAGAMRDALSGREVEHRVLTIFASDCDELKADIKLDLPRGRSAKLGLDPTALRALRKALVRLQPRCIVAHGSQPLKYLALCAPRAMPIISYRLGIAHSAAHRRPQRLFHAMLYRRAVRVAGVSRECLEEARELFLVPERRLVLIPNGRDPQRFCPSASGRPAAEAPRLVFVGHMVETKRPEFFLNVVEDLRRRGVTFDAQMIGDGPLQTSLAARASQLGIELMGRRDDVPELLRSAAVLAFTSVPDGEGMPGVFIEAGLSGLPVVSTDVPGARTVIADGQTGFVVAVNDRATFVQRTAELLEHADLRLQLGQRARERCVNEFSLESSVLRWKHLINELFTWST